MALNEIYVDANELSLPVASTVKSGDLVQVGELVGVALIDALEGEDGTYHATVKLNGAFIFETEDAFTVGSPAYHAAGVVVNDDTEKLIGHVLKVQGDRVVVRLVQSVPAAELGGNGDNGSEE